MKLKPLSEIPEERIFELVERMDDRGPRYTSYPTAPVWKSDLPVEYLSEELASLSNSDRPVAVYLHLPYCRQRCLYCGCNSFITYDSERIASYLASLQREISQVAAALPQPVSYEWLHLGGGTPTHLPPNALAGLLDHLERQLPGVESAERSIEVDPRVTTPEHLQLLRERGFGRISIGLQDLNPQVQQAIQREYSFVEMQAFVKSCRQSGFQSINIDLIYGLPFQTRVSWLETLEQVLQLAPDRLACFGYAHLPERLKHQRLIKEENLPLSRERLGMLLDANRFLVKQGYCAIGLDHFALPGDKLALAQQSGSLWRNFMGYTEIRGLEMIGFGASAISEFNTLYTQSEPNPERYRELIESGKSPLIRGHRLDHDDVIRRQLINDLMCNLIIRIPEAADQAGVEYRAQLENCLERLTPFCEDDLIIPLDSGGYQVTPLGQLFLRNLAMQFDRYLPDQQVTFSRTV
ncbi:MAG: oxygen-independent coproporphyrinogen III oxidase [Candidatus Delongbacteria bacterium]|nr:oxygen-independent coproporphyrinogen III oxidase [Candidatus Delongbacteria bacterium]